MSKGVAFASVPSAEMPSIDRKNEAKLSGLSRCDLSKGVTPCSAWWRRETWGWVSSGRTTAAATVSAVAEVAGVRVEV